MVVLVEAGESPKKPLQECMALELLQPFFPSMAGLVKGQASPSTLTSLRPLACRSTSWLYLRLVMFQPLALELLQPMALELLQQLEPLQILE